MLAYAYLHLPRFRNQRCFGASRWGHLVPSCKTFATRACLGYEVFAVSRQWVHKLVCCAQASRAWTMSSLSFLGIITNTHAHTWHAHTDTHTQAIAHACKQAHAHKHTHNYMHMDENRRA